MSPARLPNFLVSKGRVSIMLLGSGGGRPSSSNASLIRAQSNLTMLCPAHTLPAHPQPRQESKVKTRRNQHQTSQNDRFFTVENVENAVSDVSEGRGGGDGVGGDSVATDGNGGNGGEVCRPDEGGVASDLNQPPRADEYSPELQQREPFAGPARHRRLHVEERDLRPARFHAFLPSTPPPLPAATDIRNAGPGIIPFVAGLASGPRLRDQPFDLAVGAEIAGTNGG